MGEWGSACESSGTSRGERVISDDKGRQLSQDGKNIRQKGGATARREISDETLDGFLE